MEKLLNVIVLFLLMSMSSVTRASNSGCPRNETAIRLEERSCPNSCETTGCKSRNAMCTCDGSCGLSCVTQGLVCEKPKKLNNGKITFFGGRKFRDELIYSCDEGYELIGPSKRICQGDQLWSGKTPFCTPEGVRCAKPTFDIPDSDSDADYFSGEFHVGHTVTYSCSVGYVQTAFAVKTTKCELLPSGDAAAWKPEITLKCKAKECGYPDRISNGNYEGEDFSFGQLVTYYCNAGYRMVGTADRICGASQQWSGDTPECEPVTCDHPQETISHGTVRYESNTYDSIITYSCNDGYILEGSKYRTCNEDGEWDKEEPECIEGNCGEPETPSKGFLVKPYQTTWKSTAHYKCWENATGFGPMETECRIYDNKATWSILPPVCREKCKRAEENDAQYFIDYYQKWNQLFEHHSEVLMKCKRGSEISTDQSPNEITTEAKTVCNDGVWKPEFTCKPARCFCTDEGLNKWLAQRNFVKDPCKGFIQHNENVPLYCPLEYPYINKREILKCHRGRWELPSGDLRCKPYPCSLTNFLNADDLDVEVKLNKKIFWPNEIRGYSTKTNGEIYIEEFIQEDGVPDNSEISLTCRSSGYELYIDDEVKEIDYTFICSNGTFSEFSWQCKPGRCLCQTLRNKLSKDLQLNETCRYNIDSGKKIQLKCNDGYHDKTKNYFDATCDNTEWKIDDNECEKMCSHRTFSYDVGQPSLLIEEFSRFLASGDSVDLKCGRGFSQLQGDGKAKCSKGKWIISSNALCYEKCQCDSFSKDVGSYLRIQDGCNGSVDHGEKVVVKCKPQYSQRNHLELATCTKGTWEISSDVVCTEKCSCDLLSMQLLNRSSALLLKEECEDITSEDEVELECKKNYVQSKKKISVKCMRGKWEIPPRITCHEPCQYNPEEFLNGILKNLNGKEINFNEVVPHAKVVVFFCNDGYEINKLVQTRSSSRQLEIKCEKGKWKEKKECIKKTLSWTTEDLFTKRNTITTQTSDVTPNRVLYTFSSEISSTTEYDPLLTESIQLFEEPSTIVTQPSDVTPNSVLYTVPEISSTTECDPFLTDCLQFLPEYIVASDKCQFKKNAHVRAVMDGQEIIDESIEVPDQSILKLRCHKINEFFFEGDNILQCDKTKWNGTIPTCTRMSPRKRDSIPMIKYQITNGKENVDDDGTLNVTEGATLKLSCLYFKTYLKYNIKWISADKTEIIDAAWNSRENAYEIILSPISRIHESKYSCCVDQHLCNSITIRVTEFQCADPPRPNNGFIRGDVSKTLGSEIEYGCDINYVPEGEQISKCILEHERLTWSHPPPQCKERTCDRPVPPQNGYIRKIGDRKVDTVVSFACNPGYKLTGKENTTCLWIKDRLQWSDPVPECIKTTGKKCRELSVSSEKEIKYDTEPERKWDLYHWTYNYEHGTTATVTCKEGYEIFSGHPTITTAATTICVDGQWKPYILNCVEARCTCRELSKQMIERKRKFRYCNDFVESNTYHITECQEGYTAKTNYAASCIKGKWILYTYEMEHNKCNKMRITTDCQLDLRRDSGLLAIHGDTPHAENVIDFTDGSLIKFICKMFSYKLEGAKNATCIKGQWTKEKPKCVLTSHVVERLPPYVGFFYYDNGNYNADHIVADDGRIILPKHRELIVDCYTPYLKTFTLVEQNFAQKHTPLFITNGRRETNYGTIHIQPVKEKASAIVKCVNSYGSSTTFNIDVADICQINVNELETRGLRVVSDSKQRTYVEGDKIQLECSSDKYRTNQHFMICKSSWEWEYGTYMPC